MEGCVPGATLAVAGFPIGAKWSIRCDAIFGRGSDGRKVVRRKRFAKETFCGSVPCLDVGGGLWFAL